MSITVNNISKFYSDKAVLNKVSFNLEKGEIGGFLGPNGAGKSTLMKIITGYITDFEGEAFVNGINIKEQPLQAKKIIGYLPEHNPLYPEMYIPEYLLYVAKLYKIKTPQEHLKKIIEQTGLGTEKGKKIAQLSKGYRQRVGLAAALIHNPEILILDEPMTGLDPNQLIEIRNLVIEVAQDKTVLLSTHIMQEVEAVCNRIIIINKGELVTDNTKTNLKNLEKDEVLLEVTFSEEQDFNWLQNLENLTSFEKKGRNTFDLLFSSDKDPRVELFYTAAANKCPIIELKVKERNLENLFHSLTS
ncbi:MAG: ATP-binding cassette domain-containing protein [Odoribacter sp.]|nr:ATP-binding cassette domain-containing protein [Odoribacter sp.]